MSKRISIGASAAVAFSLAATACLAQASSFTPMLQDSVLASRFESDLYAHLTAHGVRFAPGRFNPFPSSYVAVAEDDAANYAYLEQRTGRSLDLTLGLFGTCGTIFNRTAYILGSNPAQLARLSGILGLSPEDAALLIAAHEGAHAHRYFTIRKAPWQRNLTSAESETYADIGALHALSLYVGKAQALVIGQRWLAFRTSEEYSSPSHDTASGLQWALAELASDQWQTPTSLQNAYTKANRTFSAWRAQKPAYVAVAAAPYEGDADPAPARPEAPSPSQSHRGLCPA